MIPLSICQKIGRAIFFAMATCVSLGFWDNMGSLQVCNFVRQLAQNFLLVNQKEKRVIGGRGVPFEIGIVDFFQDNF